MYIIDQYKYDYNTLCKQSKHARKAFTNSQKWDLAFRQDYACFGEECKGLKFLPVTKNLDHIKPLFLGGTNDIDNAQLLCPNCHQLKTRKERMEYEKYKRMVLLRQKQKQIKLHKIEHETKQITFKTKLEKSNSCQTDYSYTELEQILTKKKNQQFKRKLLLEEQFNNQTYNTNIDFKQAQNTFNISSDLNHNKQRHRWRLSYYDNHNKRKSKRYSPNVYTEQQITKLALSKQIPIETIRNVIFEMRKKLKTII